MNRDVRAVPIADGANAPLGDALFRKLGLFFDLSQDQIAFIRGACHRESRLEPGQPILRSGENHAAVYVVNEGWAVRYRLLADGSRQIANFVLPGDFIGLTACIFPAADHSIDAITPVRLAHFRISEIISMTQQHPLLCAAVFWCDSREESILLEHLADVGRRNAQERVAHLLLELYRRMQLVMPPGSLTGDTVDIPLTLDLVADALGLTSVHVSRTIKSLDQLGLIASKRIHGRWHVRIREIDELAALAGFSDEYLHFTEIPRSTEKLLQALEAERNNGHAK